MSQNAHNNVSVIQGMPNPGETVDFYSTVLDETRRIYVQLPEGYSRRDKKYPVLYVLDGEWLFHLASSHARFYSYDEVAGIRIPQVIVVGIENVDRDRDYTPTQNSGVDLVFPTAGEAETFVDFLQNELIPLCKAPILCPNRFGEPIGSSIEACVT